MTQSDKELQQALNAAWNFCGDLNQVVTKTRIDLRNIEKEMQARGSFDLTEIEENGKRMKEAAQTALKNLHALSLQAERYLEREIEDDASK